MWRPWVLLIVAAQLLACTSARENVALTLGQSYNGTLTGGEIQTVVIELGVDSTDQLVCVRMHLSVCFF